MATTAVLPPFPEDWMQTLAVKQRQGRRIRPECQPPYLTMDGPILVDRRSHQDRRKPLGPASSASTNLSDDSVSPLAIVHTSISR